MDDKELYALLQRMFAPLGVNNLFYLPLDPDMEQLVIGSDGAWLLDGNIIIQRGVEG